MTEKEKEELAKFSKLFDDYIDDKVYNNRPRRYDDPYIKMEKVESYEYTYVLAYELSRRNKRVIEHFEKAKYYQKHIEAYNNPTNLTDFYKDSIELGYGSFLEEKETLTNNNSFFEIIDPGLTLNDIQRFDHDLEVDNIGLWKLIAYLIDTNNLYSCIGNGICIPIDVNEAEKRIADIMENPYQYAAYCKVEDSQQKKLTYVSKDMPLEILDQDFLKDLNIIRTKNKIPHAKINYSTPTLRFKEDKVINIPVNLNLSKEELKEYISKIKDDFDENRDILKSPLEVFGEKLINATKPKNQKKNASKKDFADAIYIYDLYKYIENIFEKKLKKDTDYSQKNLHEEVSLASGISDSHNYYLIHYTVKKSKNKKGDNFRKSDTIEAMYKLMREYIDDEKYRELITGSTINKIQSMWDRIPTSPLYSISIDELNKK